MNIKHWANKKNLVFLGGLLVLLLVVLLIPSPQEGPRKPENSLPAVEENNQRIITSADEALLTGFLSGKSLSAFTSETGATLHEVSIQIDPTALNVQTKDGKITLPNPCTLFCTFKGETPQQLVVVDGNFNLKTYSAVGLKLTTSRGHQIPLGALFMQKQALHLGK